MRFEGEVVLVTGAAQGIGKEIALSFAKEKAQVVLIDMNEEALKNTQDELKIYSDCAYYCLNVTDIHQVEAGINKIIDKFSKIDIVVNNAGITKDNLALRLSENDWDQVIGVNLKGAFLCSKLCARQMVKQRSGKIVNISSIIGIVGNAGQSNYSASKAGLIGLTKSFAKELGSRSICVNAVAPGYIRTRMTEKLPEKVTVEMLKRIPLNRLGEPKDVAEAVLFLTSQAANYITGQVLVVDGGMI